MPPSGNYRVALLIESSRSYGRGLLGGIGRYVHAHENWSLRHQELSMAAGPPPWLRRWDGDGILARIESRRMGDIIQSLGVPTVDLRGSLRLPRVPVVDTDDRAVVRLAVDHLWNQGFRRFAFCGFEHTNYSVHRLAFFRQELAARGVDVRVYESPGPRQPTTTAAELRGMLDEEGVQRWIAGLEKPVGLMACNDIRGQQVLSACKRVGVAVPDEMAVIGVDNDDVICPLCDPSLSSVQPDTQRIGYEAAELLQRMMDGASADSDKKILIPPRGVTARRSTDVVPVEDRVAATAYRFIREQACAGISVRDVMREVGVSRRSLERCLKQHFDRTPAALIADFRRQRIERLLVDTDYGQQRIAELAGFKYVEHMSVFFKQRTGLSPGQYRRRRTGR